MRAVPKSRELVSLGDGQPIGGELLHGPQHREAIVPPPMHEALVDERGDRLKVRSTHLLRSPEIEAGWKYREVLEQFAFPRGQQVLTPFNRCPERLMTRGHVTRPTGEHRQSAFQSRQQRTESQHVHPRGGELERQGETVETAADRLDRLLFDERGVDGTRLFSLDEEGDGIGGAGAAAP